MKKKVKKSQLPNYGVIEPPNNLFQITAVSYYMLGTVWQKRIEKKRRRHCLYKAELTIPKCLRILYDLRNMFYLEQKD